jgi:copper(I)-binding protein
MLELAMPRPADRPRARLIAVILLLVTAGVVQAQPPLTVTGAWVREPVPGRASTAAYAVVENRGSSEVQIVGVTADIAGVVEIHEMVRSGDMMKMAPVRTITVPANGRVELEPGGLHVMLFELKTPMKDGDTVTLTFETSTGTTVRTPAAVRKPPMR